jgi:hypothetical protein
MNSYSLNFTQSFVWGKPLPVRQVPDRPKSQTARSDPDPDVHADGLS